jgi:hypothetical protein
VKNGGLGLLRHSASFYMVTLFYSWRPALLNHRNAGKAQKASTRLFCLARLNIHAFSTRPCFIWISADCSCSCFKIHRNLQLQIALTIYTLQLQRGVETISYERLPRGDFSMGTDHTVDYCMKYVASYIRHTMYRCKGPRAKTHVDKGKALWLRRLQFS